MVETGALGGYYDASSAGPQHQRLGGGGVGGGGGHVTRYAADDWIDSLFVELDQSRDPRPTYEPPQRQHVTYRQHNYTWPANNCAHRPRAARPCSCWTAESRDVSTDAPTAHCYDMWPPSPPRPHSYYYRRQHHHYHH